MIEPDERFREILDRLSSMSVEDYYNPSLNVHGIRELLIEVTKRIHAAEFAVLSQFFNHFIGEENEHMWFFAEFCLRYGSKIYKQPRGGAETIPSNNAESLLVFARILIFEELVDHFNSKMVLDKNLHDTIRRINRIHYQDEFIFVIEQASGVEIDLETLDLDDLRTLAAIEKRFFAG